MICEKCRNAELRKVKGEEFRREKMRSDGEIGVDPFDLCFLCVGLKRLLCCSEEVFATSRCPNPSLSIGERIPHEDRLAAMAGRGVVMGYFVETQARTAGGDLWYVTGGVWRTYVRRRFS